MSLDTAVPRSRRALLGAALGAAVASVASALGRPDPVRANDPNDVVLGAANMTSSTTMVYNTSSPPDLSAVGLWGQASAGVGVRGVCDGAAAGVAGVFGSSKTGVGVRGTTEVANLSGVEGRGPIGVAGWGGVNPTSLHDTTGTGVYGSGTATGVHGYAAQDAAAMGVLGKTIDGSGVKGWATGAGIGVNGYSASGTSVLGSSNQGTAVHGDSGSGTGVRGTSTSGTGVRAENYTGGTALDVVGRAKFSRSGKIKIATGRYYGDVTPAGGLGGTPLIFATLQYYRSGTYVIGVRANWPSTGRFRIYLNKPLTSATYVAWVVIG